MTTFSDNSWRDIYDTMLPKVFHYFAYRAGNTQIAEDLTSITFEKAWKARRNFKREKGRVESWLFRIARNVAIDYFRNSNEIVHLDDLDHMPSTHSIENTLDKNDRYAKLSRLLSTQPQRVRDLISLKYGAELTNRRIAKITGLSETNVGTILHRAVNSLREQWEDEDG